VPSLLHSRGLLAGAGSAASLIAAALTSLLFATGLVAFSSWPGAGGSSVPSVNLPSSAPAGGVPTGAAGRASAVSARPAIVLPTAASAPGRRGVARTIARTGGRGGTTTAGAPAPVAAPGSPSPSAPPAPSAPRPVTDGLADTTSSATHQVGSAVGGPVGDTIQATGDQVAQTVRDVGTAAQPLLGALG
jgi:hypothetical protein